MKYKLFRNLVFVFLILIISGKSYGQFDSIAVAILDSMSDRISQLETCSFRFYTEYDINSDEYGLITHSESGNVFLKGPDKLYIDKKGDKGHKSIYYNGKSFLVYSFDKNQYASVPAELRLIDLIDSISSYYGVEFPGADVFYPDFTDDILEHSTNLLFLGITMVVDSECYHIAGVQNDMNFQMWITADGQYIPMKMTIDYTKKAGTPRYRIVFLDWKSDEEMNDSKFEFVEPPGAQKITISKK